MRLLLMYVLLVSGLSEAVIETYTFKTPEKQAQYNRLIDELRCPKCQNQNLSGSNAPIAQDLRFQIYRLLEEEQSEQEIIDFLVARYGEFVRYDPPVNAKTLALWLIPLFLLLLGGFVIYRIKTAGTFKDQSLLSDDEKQRLDEMLS
ncbi:MAG: cytochrome c-type biogenesis protein CcmH [Cellvibrionales bacterium]|nr:cytochrome c-type biogenesis protein CcmH [Cellvibrionales bacterium]